MKRWRQMLSLAPVLLALVMIGLRPAPATTTTYLYNNAAVGYVGNWANQSGSGHNFCAALANGAWGTNFGFTGTQAAIQIYVTTAGAFQYSLDGAAPVTSNVTTLSAFTTYTVVTGLADTTHTLVISRVGSNTFDLAQDATIQITGSAPALSPVSTYNPVYNLDRTGTDFLGRVGISGDVNLDGAWISSVLNASYIPSNALTQATANGNNWSDADIDFYATTPAISAYVFCNSTSLRLVVDGVPLAPVALPSTGWQLIPLATGLDGSHQHRYRIYVSMPPVQILQIVTPGGTINTTAGPSVRPPWVLFGDSICSGTTGTVGQTISGLSDTWLNWGARLCNAFNVACYNKGIGGTTAFNTAGQSGSSGAAAVTTLSGQARAATDLASISPSPQICIIGYGINDAMNVSGMSPAETTAQYQGAMVSIITSAVAALPSTCRIIVLGVWPRTGWTQSQMAPWTAAAAAAVATVGAPNVSFVDPWSWYNPSTDTVDGLHPDGYGSLEIFLQMQSLVSTVKSRGVHAGGRLSFNPAPAMIFETLRGATHAPSTVFSTKRPQYRRTY